MFPAASASALVYLVRSASARGRRSQVAEPLSDTVDLHVSSRLVAGCGVGCRDAGVRRRGAAVAR
jgi:hypothetical protein